MRLYAGYGCLIATLLFVGCGGGGASSVDAATDGSLDAAADGSLDAATDGSLDAATDGSLDAAADGSLDAATDGSLDAAMPDGSLDAAMPDAGGGADCPMGSYDDDGDPVTACVMWTDCAAGQEVATPGTPASDRTCIDCAGGTFSAAENASSCTAWSVCDPGSYVTETPSATLDRACTACTAGEYSDTTNASSCTAWSVCDPGSYVTETPSATLDRACTTCTAGEYSDTTNASSCTACAAIAHCATGLRCTGASDQTCGTCDAGYFLQSGGTICAPPWVSQFGTRRDDQASAVAMDGAGDIYVVGYTNDALEHASAGSRDAFVRKYSDAGVVIWARQFGTASIDDARSVAVDGSGNVYVAGYTNGSLVGVRAGASDVFVRKYSGAGAVLWTRQFGTSARDEARAVAVDGSGNVYVAGDTDGAVTGSSAGSRDVFVRKYSSAGVTLWTRQFGTSQGDYGRSVAVDGSGNVFVGGDTLGALSGASAGRRDVFVRKFSSAGGVLWTRQFGTSSADAGESIATDTSGNVYVAGGTLGALDGTSSGTEDAYLRKYSGAGAVLWTRQFGPGGREWGQSVAVDSAGDVYVAGYTDHALVTAFGRDDLFVRKYDAAGGVLWTQQLGSSRDDMGASMAVDSVGRAYVAANTNGTWPGQVWAGLTDAVVVRFAP